MGWRGGSEVLEEPEDPPMSACGSPGIVGRAVAGAPLGVGLDVDNPRKWLVGTRSSVSANENPVLLASHGIEGNLFEILRVHEVVQ